MARKKRKRPHHTGSYQYRDGRHVVQWTENGKRRTKTLASAEEVPSFLARACGGLEAKKGYSGKLADLAETWLAGREDMASNYDYRNRWKNHLAPLLGFLTPDQVDVPVLKRVIQELKAKGLSKGTVGLCMAILSSFFGDLVEDGVAKLNPVRMLSRKTRARELVSEQDWKKTPFIQTTEDVRRVHLWLEQRDRGVAIAYIIGALAGLRTSEVRALLWGHIDLGTRLIHVQDQTARRGAGVTDLKDDDSRFVPISDALYWYLRNHLSPNAPANQIIACAPGGGFVSARRMGKLIARALAALEIRPMRWYEATRHTFASQWVVNGGSLETLRDMMGHSSVTTTERYAHLVPGLYSDADRARVAMPAPTSVEKVMN